MSKPGSTSGCGRWGGRTRAWRATEESRPAAGSDKTGARMRQVNSPQMHQDLLIHDLAEIATPRGTTPRVGPEQAAVTRLHGAEVLCRNGQIAFVGTPVERVKAFGELPDAETLNDRRGTVMPGFVDPTT